MAQFRLEAAHLAAASPHFSGYQQLLQALPTAAYTCDAEGRLTGFNTHAENLWGRTPALSDPQERYCGSHRIYTPTGEPLSREQCWMARALREHTSFAERRAIIERPDGSRRLVLAHASPIHDVEGKLVGGINVLIDITEQSRAEAHLRESDERLQLALAASRMGVWEWNVRTNEVFWSSECVAVLGRRIQGPLTLAAIHDVVYPDDLDEVMKAAEQAVAGQGNYVVEFRVFADDGSIRWICNHGRADYDESGAPLRVVGTIQDVTERKLEERALRGQNDVLENIAGGAPLRRTLADICRVVEAQLPGAICSVMLIDDDGRRLRSGAGPSLPDAYHAAVDGIPVGDGVGSCGTAAFRRRQVVSVDLQTDPLWGDFRWVVERFGLRACWSVPILGGRTEPVANARPRIHGTFGVYFRRPTSPTAAALRVIARAAHLASIAVERARFENAILAEEERFRTFVEHANDAFFILRLDDGVILDVNGRACESLGYSRDELLGRTPALFGLNAHPEKVRRIFERLERGEIVAFDSVHRRKDGTTFPVEIRVRAFQVGHNRKALASARDVTERKSAERKIRESEQRYRLLAERAQVVLWEADPVTFQFTYVSDFAEDLLGFPREHWYRQGFWVEQLYEQDRNQAVEFCSHHARAHLDHRFEYRMVRADGRIVWVEDVVTVVPEADGFALRGVLVDITERKAAERKLTEALRSKAETLALLDTLHAEAPVGLALLDREGRYLRCNDALAKINGLPAAEHLGRTMADVLPDYWPQVRPIFDVILSDSIPVVNRELQGETPALPGVERHWLSCFYPVKMGEELLGVGVIFNEVTELKRVEAALRRSELRHRAIVEAIPDMMFRLDGASRIIDYHAPPQASLAAPPEQFLNRHVRESLPPHIADMIETNLCEVLSKHSARTFEYELPLAGELFGAFEARMVPSGDQEAIAVVRDVTEARRFEEQMRKLQKLEAVARLAGGVAHDFNNLLTIINGYSELLLKKFDRDDPRQASLAAVRDAGYRAAGLVRQLLAFSREQVFRLELLDVSEVVARMEALLRGLLHADVELAFRFSATGLLVQADRSQVEQVVINLVANARDAMSGGGRLTLGTDVVEVCEPRPAAVGEVRPGKYVRIVVIDNGHGMSRAVMNKIFEPFFTTKEVGKGTGLGLPSVDGIVRQSGGFVEMESEVNVGTTISVLLPLADQLSQT